MGFHGIVLVKSSKKAFVTYRRTERMQTRDNPKKSISGRKIASAKVV